MTPLLDMINHLLANWLAGQSGGDAWTLRELRMEPTGGVLLGRLDHPQCQGEVVVRLVVDAPQGTRQTIRLHVEQWPEKIPAGLEPFRGLLEKARLSLELDFSD